MSRRGRAAGPYGRFARYYDFIYHRLVNYRGDVAFLEETFDRFLKQRPRDLLDLGCGTGTHAVLLTRRGYRVTGLDRSRQQLAIARRKAREAGLRIRFVQGDMRSFDLGATLDAAICMFGAFGYLVKSTDIAGCLRSLRRHLRPGGLFVFEFWQGSGAKPSPYQSWLHLTGPDYELVRLDESRFDPRTRRLSMEFRFFALRGRRVLDRFTEGDAVRTFTTREMRRLLARAGFDLLGAYGATRMEKGFRKATAKDFRVMAIARLRARA